MEKNTEYDRLVCEANALLKSDNQSDVRAGMRVIEDNASAGDPYAIYALAKWHRIGFGGYPIDPIKDLTLTKSAADELVPDAVFDLGAKVDGEEWEKREQALSFYIVSAIMGDLSAMEAIIDMLKNTDTLDGGEEAANILQKYVETVVRPSRVDL